MRSFILLFFLGVSSLSFADQAQLDQGKVVYEHWCTPCHGAGSSEFGFAALPGTNALMALYKGAKPAVLTEREDLEGAYVKAIVRQGVSIMPFFRKTEISDDELDAIAAYLEK